MYSQKIKDIKVQNKFDQKLADSLGADKYGMKPYVIVILKTGKANITDKEQLNKHFSWSHGKFLAVGKGRKTDSQKTKEINVEFSSLI